MSGNRSRSSRQRVVAVFAGLAFVTAGAFTAFTVGADSETPAQAVFEKEPDRAWNFGSASAASVPGAGSQIRDRIVKAHGDISESLSGSEAEMGDVQDIALELAAARGQLEEILDASPAVRIKGHLFAAAQAIPAGDGESVTQQLGTVEAELEAAPDWPSVERTRMHVEAAQKQMAQGEVEAAFESLKAADDQVVLASRDMTAAETYYLVSVALAALVHQDPSVAVQALEAARQSVDAYVTEVTTVAPAPVVPAIRQAS